METTPIPPSPVIDRLALNKREACISLGVSQVTLYRLEKRGLIHSIPGIRHKLYSVEVLKRFASRVGAE